MLAIQVLHQGLLLLVHSKAGCASRGSIFLKARRPPLFHQALLKLASLSCLLEPESLHFANPNNELMDYVVNQQVVELHFGNQYRVLIS